MEKKLKGISSISLTLSLSLLLLLASFSCQPIYRLTHGTKKPAVIPNEELIKRSKDLGIYAAGKMYSISYDGWITFTNTNTDFPTFHVYRGDLKYESNNPLGCNQPVTEILSNIADSNLVDAIPVDSSNFYGHYLVNVETSKKPSFDISRYSLLIFWVSYGGRFNEPVLGYLEEVKNRDDVDVYIVSCDPREDW